MHYLRKLPNSRRSPPGLEVSILRKLPTVTLASTFIPLACYVIAALYPDPAPGADAEKYLTGVGIAAIATVITAWTAIFTTAIGCAVVHLMKGPAYVADRYELIDSDKPGQEDRGDWRKPGAGD